MHSKKPFEIILCLAAAAHHITEAFVPKISATIDACLVRIKANHYIMP